MTRNALAKLMFVTTLLALALAWAPAAALAAGPPMLTPSPIFTEGFEGALASRAYLDWVLPTPGDPSPAYWGRITQRKHTGSYGLWCAGSIPNQTTSAAWTTFAGRYPDYTKGMAVFDVPELADYYSANLDYWYDMPSIGSNDGDALNIDWSATTGGDFWQNNIGQAVVSVWTRNVYSLTAPTPPGAYRPVNLSRTPGKVRFLFIDDASAYESPTNGEGPTIDDVTVTGYKYGPVRNLAATVTGSGVNLSWMMPARSTALLAASEERPVTYRVWRSPDVQPYTWTEVTDARVSGTTLLDTAPLDGTSRYIVQAWDLAGGSGYGEVDVAAAAYAVVVPPVPVSTIAVTGGTPSGGVYTTMPTITVSRNSASGMTYYRWDSGSYASSAMTSFEVPALAGPHTLEVYSVNSLNMAETPTVKQSITVSIPSPGPAPVSTITVGGTPDSSGVYTTTPTITVSRDQAEGTTYYRWDSAMYEATSSASLQVPALAGTHVLEVYSLSSTGILEDPTRTRSLTVSVPVVKTKPAVSTPTLSTSYVRHYKSFYIRGSVGPAHAVSTTVKVRIYRYYSGHYHWSKTYIKTVPAGATSYSVKAYLSRTGTYRVRAYHSCPLHIGTYSLYRKFTVHT
jgi:hypothetical protein